MAWIEGRIRAFQEAFAGIDPLIAYSVKANGNLSILRRLWRSGCGADIISLGELHRAAGRSPGRARSSSPAWQDGGEMCAALEHGIHAFNVESAEELECLDGVARAWASPRPSRMRVNPDVLSPTPHEYTATGHAGHQVRRPRRRGRRALPLGRGAPRASGPRHGRAHRLPDPRSGALPAAPGPRSWTWSRSCAPRAWRWSTWTSAAASASPTTGAPSWTWRPWRPR